MFEQELEKIRGAEARAEEIVKKAGADGKAAEAAGREAAAECLRKAEAEAARTVSRYRQEGTETADRQQREAAEAAEAQVRALRDQAEKKAPEAVRMITERIVSISVDR